MDVLKLEYKTTFMTSKCLIVFLLAQIENLVAKISHNTTSQMFDCHRMRVSEREREIETPRRMNALLYDFQQGAYLIKE